MNQNNIYKSFLKKEFNSFFEYRIGLGYSGERYRSAALKLDNYLFENHPDELVLSEEMFNGFITNISHLSDSTVNDYIRFVRLLSTYLKSLDIHCYCPDENMGKRMINRYNPCLLDENSMRKLFNTIDAYKSPSTSPSLFHVVCPVLFRMMYCCGLRPNEPGDLKCSDVNLENGVLTIRYSKRHKTRSIPMSVDLVELCRKYDSVISSIFPNREYFFVIGNGQKVKPSNIQLWLNRILKISGLQLSKKMRPYDFRHNFATRSILKMHKKGVNPDNYIAKLSAYMGHDSFEETYHYISLMPELLLDLELEIDWNYANSALNGVEIDNE